MAVDGPASQGAGASAATVYSTPMANGVKSNILYPLHAILGEATMQGWDIID